MSSITDPEVRAFLSAGTRTGKLGFLSPSGHPLVAPVWFVLEDDTVVFNTGKDTAKGRYLAGNPRVSLCMGAERAAEFGRRNGVPGELVVRVRPTRVLAVFDMTG